MSHNIWEGEKVTLRAVEPKDADFFSEMNVDHESMRKLEAIDFPQSYEKAKEFAEKKASEKPENDRFHWIAENKKGEVVGDILTFKCDQRSGNFYYGVYVVRAHWGNGYAREMIRLLLSYYFFELNYQKVTAEVYSFNDRSIRLHEGFGFQKEGELRRVHYTGGQYHNKLLYGMTREEFEERYGGPQIGD